MFIAMGRKNLPWQQAIGKVDLTLNVIEFFFSNSDKKLLSNSTAKPSLNYNDNDINIFSVI